MDLFVRSIYISSAFSLGYLFLLYRSNPLRRLPGTTVTLCFIVGMLGVIPVEWIHLLFPTIGRIPSMFIAASLVEEGVKFGLMGLTIWKFPFPDLAEPIDLAIYFGALGLGFGAYEDFWYIFSSTYPAWSVGEIARYQVVFRNIIIARAVPGHVLFDAIAGFLVGSARFLPGRGRTARIVGGFVVAVCLHSAYNLIARYGGMLPLLSYAVFLVGLFVHLRMQAIARSPFNDLIEFIEGRTDIWLHPRAPIEYLFADGFYWPGRPRRGMFELLPLTLSFVILYPLFFGVIYLINAGIVGFFR